LGPYRCSDNPELADEYDSYIGGVDRPIASGASDEEIAAHLSRVERENLGFDQAAPARLLEVGRALVALDVRLEHS